ncbi:MAG: tRNA (adenosine(37)-N6)-threonylcarbamoyltransferase complex transferase subunit TsaD [Candidatus Caldatribacterium sp.]|uniref:tRNA (adenosine(37)-N6)-threonylcarbamoyltransferase complex transferase subunit TsaD n=1 Tax=Candidatus Caldatribacterium sp. TaxID=2282143 RepID=UPI002990B7F6|nr:tRNA (adenosine(37)-N6)-threonylcarbamoyltransferase complex transferase subunit TsaD [Candidatus Caldatribacterium sp.]MCX7731394.1 tRNA (adenosine(37)-N6)-threonylcarbamoyltransferase complex transferase subunit TsaD [Candidatus Caldatribacterium sp.]MDW8080896.1 tRNA (adenosine(37)-N6)-threonylcarbamoyltransferase complex transferase subunit TsaD [Candidatus Calescibacterium sp.]
MKRSLLILGIETSCDDSCVAVVSERLEVLSNIVSSQIDVHRVFGGIVPEIASRKHLEALPWVLHKALEEAGITLRDIDAFAVTQGPGLLGALLMGMGLAKALSFALGKPLIGVNHLEGHVFAARFEHPGVSPPFVALIVSGGHTELLAVLDWGKYVLLGRTRDDAAGEAYDKVARLLGLGYPGGPAIDRLSRGGDRKRFAFRGGLEDEDTFDFSFSGLKTAVARVLAQFTPEERKDTSLLADLAACFQESVVRSLVKKAFKAVEMTGYRLLVVGGGVAANHRLREVMREEGEKKGIRVLFPSHEFCTDNAAMIAACGLFHFLRGRRDNLEIDPVPQLSLGERCVSLG